jgi:hypothetical protein
MPHSVLALLLSQSLSIFLRFALTLKSRLSQKSFQLLYADFSSPFTHAVPLRNNLFSYSSFVALDFLLPRVVLTLCGRALQLSKY